VTPAAEDSLAKAMKRAHQLYAQYVNRLHGRSGHASITLARSGSESVL